MKEVHRLSKYIEVKVTATVTIEETWRVPVPDDTDLPDLINPLERGWMLTALDRGACVYERSLGDEHDREITEVTWAQPYNHDARPDDLPEPGDRCKDCGENITWVGPGMGDWLHVGDEANL